uniref:Homogentisate 1,2-dioxygenase n=1 Tax=Ixodes ricinus TaxID=34613 RepID=A0A6B0VBL3_IXORI
MDSPMKEQTKDALVHSPYPAGDISKRSFDSISKDFLENLPETSLQYLTGFGNEFASEDPRCPGALPEGQNNPQDCPYGLYAEQLSGTAFMTPRQTNRRSWLYRICPSVQHPPYSQYPTKTTIDWSTNKPNPSQMLFKPFDIPEPTKSAVDFVDGLNTFSGAGDPKTRHGMAIHIYCCNTSMKDKAMSNADGDFMIIPQQGALFILTEFGRLHVEPNEICVIQQGMHFQVHVSGPSRGYLLEVYDNHFILPDLGPIGANGLANPRDFKTPTAWFEDREVSNFTLVNKYQGLFFQTILDHSPFDVVAWHGNYVPYKYDLANFVAVSSVSFDHSDSSIFTLLTCPSANLGKALVNITIFRPRWSVADHTFRPPFYHRNSMSEFMGLISTEYKPGEKRFQPGGATFHGMMASHGVGAEWYEYNRTVELIPKRVGEGSMAFMIESSLNMTVTKWAEHDCGKLDPDYYKEWQGMAKNFNPNWKPPKKQ